MTDERLSDEQVNQLIGNGECFLHHHPDSVGASAPPGLGMVKTGSGNFALATPGVDYLHPDAVGTTVQPYDAQLSSLVRQVIKGTNYTLVATDAGKHILHPSYDTGTKTYYIPSNVAVPFPIGTVVTFVNQHGAGVLTIWVNSDTMYLAGAGTTGARTLAANGIATAMKVADTEWIISGTGLT